MDSPLGPTATIPTEQTGRTASGQGEQPIQALFSTCPSGETRRRPHHAAAPFPFAVSLSLHSVLLWDSLTVGDLEKKKASQAKYVNKSTLRMIS